MCDCEACQMSRRVSELRSHLSHLVGDVGEKLVGTLDDLYSAYVHQGLDHGHMTAIIDNQWPSAEEYMKSKGWIRDSTC